MECICPADSVCSWNLREKVKEELIRGHKHANQLRCVLVGDGDGGLAEGLVTKIESTFTTLFSLVSGNHESKGEYIQANTTSTVAPPTIVDSSSWGALEATIKSTEIYMDRGGSCKKRKTSHSWSRDTPDFVDDGHVWRKYGQKEILNASHPRSYFRCSHKYDQGCKATKQVQKVEDDPSLFRITYFGNHTCKHSLIKAPELILDSVSSGIPREQSNSKFTIKFENTNNCAYKHPFFSSYSSTEREISNCNHVASNQPSSSSPNYLVPLDQQAVLESSEPISGLPTMMELDYEDIMVYYKEMMGYFDQESLPI